jgi:hypothetical protein
MKTLFIGPNDGTSRHRFQALSRLGHEARLIDPRRLLPRSSLIDKVEWKVHPAPLCAWVRPRVMRLVGGERFDLALVESPLVGPKLVQDLKRCCSQVANFVHDDPFGPRDGQRFAAYRAAVPFYDLIVVVRTENVTEARQLGARKVLHSFRVADDVEHAPREITSEEERRWSSEVAFVGTWMPERGPLLVRLAELGVPLTIFGDRWERSPEWPTLRKFWRTPGLGSRDYSLAVQCAKVCLGLVSKGNRDQHTTRSMEIPSLGTVLCAERTPEHLELYQDGVEAIFWSSPEECAQQCAGLLADEERRKAIAERGHARFLANGHTTESLIRRIISATFLMQETAA